jgi:hypothetical protein
MTRIFSHYMKGFGAVTTILALGSASAYAETPPKSALDDWKKREFAITACLDACHSAPRPAEFDPFGLSLDRRKGSRKRNDIADVLEALRHAATNAHK